MATFVNKRIPYCDNVIVCFLHTLGEKCKIRMHQRRWDFVVVCNLFSKMNFDLKTFWKFYFLLVQLVNWIRSALELDCTTQTLEWSRSSLWPFLFFWFLGALYAYLQNQFLRLVLEMQLSVRKWYTIYGYGICSIVKLRKSGESFEAITCNQFNPIFLNFNELVCRIRVVYVYSCGTMSPHRPGVEVVTFLKTKNTDLIYL